MWRHASNVYQPKSLSTSTQWQIWCPLILVPSIKSALPLVPGELLDEASYTSLVAFLEQEKTKEEILIGPDRHYRGFQSLGANVTRYDGGFQRDWHEAIDLYKEEDPLKLQVCRLRLKHPKQKQNS